MLIPVDKLPAKGLDYSRNYTDRLIKDGRLPPPIYLSPRKRAFIEPELDRVVAARMAGKSDDEIRVLIREMVAARDKEAA